MTDLPFCSLEPDALTERLAAWSDLDAALLSRRDTATGMEAVYRLEPGLAERLLTLIEAEGDCCPGLRFEATVTVTVTGP